jgi:hypothetical protein
MPPGSERVNAVVAREKEARPGVESRISARMGMRAPELLLLAR